MTSEWGRSLAIVVFLVAAIALAAPIAMIAADSAVVDESGPDGDRADSTNLGVLDLVERGWAIPFFAIPMRIQRETALINPSRRRIHALVEAHPGIHLRALIRITGLAFGDVSYHVRVLERTGYTSSAVVGGRRCFYPHGVEPVLTAPQITRRRLQVLERVERQPGIGARELASALELSPKTVGYHMRGLRESGLVSAECAGRTLRFHLAPLGATAQSRTTNGG